MTVVDSSVWIDLLRRTATPQTEWLRSNPDRQRFAVGDLMLVEVLQGIPTERQLRDTLALLSNYLQIDIAGREVAVAAARNVQALRARGITVRKTIDTLIATRCIMDGHALLFSDRDFAPFVAHLGLRAALPPVAA